VASAGVSFVVGMKKFVHFMGGMNNGHCAELQAHLNRSAVAQVIRLL
jgi:hypothetical protein